MQGISDNQWAAYENIINNAHNYFNKAKVVWHRLTTGLQRYGEDNKSNNTYEEITLECLITYNIFRTWPINENTPSGLLDRENIVLMINRKYLTDLGYLNTDGFFAFDPGQDYFTHMGQTYRAMGETAVSQTKSDPLHFYIILIRQKTETGNSKF